MKFAKLIILIAVVTIAGATVATASLGRILPESSMSDRYFNGTAWYDETLDNGLAMRGRIDFAVYDDITEWTSEGFEDPGGTGDYLYAYQIFNDYGDYSEAYIESFSISSYGGAEVGSIGAQDDAMGGTEASFDTGAMLWEFEGVGGLLASGEHSWLLVFRSSHAPTEGTYSLTGAESDTPWVPNPEPASLMLLGGGALWMLNKKRNRKQIV